MVITLELSAFIQINEIVRSSNTPKPVRAFFNFKNQ
jgi:hypothetical protein